jgi:hypothetical protein
MLQQTVEPNSIRNSVSCIRLNTLFPWLQQEGSCQLEQLTIGRMLLSLPLALAHFLLGLLFEPEDEVSVFLCNIRLSLNYMMLQPRRPH